MLFDRSLSPCAQPRGQIRTRKRVTAENLTPQEGEGSLPGSLLGLGCCLPLTTASFQPLEQGAAAGEKLFPACCSECQQAFKSPFWSRASAWPPGARTNFYLWLLVLLMWHKPATLVAFSPHPSQTHTVCPCVLFLKLLVGPWTHQASSYFHYNDDISSSSLRTYAQTQC